MHRSTFALVIAAALVGGPAAVDAQSGSAPAAQTLLPAAPAHIPDTAVWLGTVRLPVAVNADGQRLAPGTYRVRLTGEHATEPVAGQSPQLERWVEFVQGTQVKGRAMAPVVPEASARDVAERTLPARGKVRAERLKGDDYYRLWFNYRGDQVLVYLPIA